MGRLLSFPNGQMALVSRDLKFKLVGSDYNSYRSGIEIVCTVMRQVDWINDFLLNYA